MPWQSDDDNVSFSGPLADLMSLIMNAYEHDCAEGTPNRPTAGEYVTAAAVVLREVLLENFEEDPEAAEFVQHISDALAEDEDGTVHIATFELLDEIAEHIDTPALEHWLGSMPVRNAIVELATTAFA
jgi:hypothetical protein